VSTPLTIRIVQLSLRVCPGLRFSWQTLILLCLLPRRVPSPMIGCRVMPLVIRLLTTEQIRCQTTMLTSSSMEITSIDRLLPHLFAQREGEVKENRDSQTSHSDPFGLQWVTMTHPIGKLLGRADPEPGRSICRRARRSIFRLRSWDEKTPKSGYDFSSSVIIPYRKSFLYRVLRPNPRTWAASVLCPPTLSSTWRI